MIVVSSYVTIKPPKTILILVHILAPFNSDNQVNINVAVHRPGIGSTLSYISRQRQYHKCVHLGRIPDVDARASLHSRIICIVPEESSNTSTSGTIDFLKDPPEAVKYAHRLTPFFYFGFGRKE